jgi:hypothetical protein
MSLLTDSATKNPLLSTTALGVATWLLAIGITLVVRLVYWRPWTSPLRTLRGPDGGTGPAGHYLELLEWVSNQLDNRVVSQRLNGETL